MNSKLPSYYFDACIYLAFLRNETDSYSKQKIRAIENVWNLTQRGGAIIVTSSLTITEVLAQEIQVKARKKFIQVIENGLHQLEDPTPFITLKAAEYRLYYCKNPLKNPFGEGIRSDLTALDAIHLATATTVGCEQFWTFDGVGKKKQIGLLWLKNQVAKDSLIITQPELIQGELAIEGV